MISRYTKITADTEQELRDAVEVFDETRRKNEKVSSIFQQRKRRWRAQIGHIQRSRPSANVLKDVVRI